MRSVVVALEGVAHRPSIKALEAGTMPLLEEQQRHSQRDSEEGSANNLLMRLQAPVPSSRFRLHLQDLPSTLLQHSMQTTTEAALMRSVAPSSQQLRQQVSIIPTRSQRLLPMLS